MGNSKDKKVPKKRRASNKSKCRTSSDQKENVPKNEKTRAIKPEPNDGIAMSKQLLIKKNKVRTQRRRSSSKPEKICPNGKPLSSLAELKKYYEEDSDDDNEAPKTPTHKPRYTTSTPEKQTPINISEKNLTSPTTIIKITERLWGSIEKQNFPDPSEVLEATSLFREKSPPPPPIVPPKKRKKPEVPYIVGCKDRPKVIRKPNTNFCKGDDDYGVEPSSEPEVEPSTKRAKKSRIPNYTKSIFNAHSDEIAERLTKDDAGGISDASSDSNKTIEYYPTLSQKPKSHSFSPLPSTSTDSETFRKNDELFNESLQEINITKESTPKIKDDDLPMIELSTPKKKEDDFFITNELTPKKKGDCLITKQLTPKKRDDILINKQSTPKKIEDDLQIIDIPYDTVVIEDISERTVGKQHTSSPIDIDCNVIEIIDSVESEVVKPKEETIIHNIPIHKYDDCIIVSSSETIKNNNNFKLNEPIVIDDEYSTINMEFYSFNNEPIEITDIDDIIAENKSVLEKWKNVGSKELNTMNTVIEVPTTYRNGTVALQTTVTPNTTVQTTVTPSTTLQTTVNPSIQTPSTPSSTLQASVTPSPTPNTSSTPNPNNNLNITNRSQATNSQNNQRQPTSVSNTQRTAAFQNILDDFFGSRRDRSMATTALDFENGIAAVFSEIFNTLPRPRPSSNSNRMPSHSVNNATPISINAMPVSTNAVPENGGNRRRYDFVELNNSPSHAGTQQTSTTIPPPSSVPSRNIGDCPICLDPLNSSNGIASTICGHVFCLTCIQASVKTNGKKCPTCRKALKGAGGGYHQLYL